MAQDQDTDRTEQEPAEARTAPSTGAWLPLSLAAGAGAVFHAIPPLATLSEKMHFGRLWWHPVDRLSPFLWERLIHARMTAGWWQTGLGLVEVALCIGALTQVRRRLNLAALLFAAAALLNGADWFLGFDILHNPALNDPERRAAITFAVSELALALLLWLRVRSSARRG